MKRIQDEPVSVEHEPTFSIITTRVVRESKDYTFAFHGPTIGQQVDNTISEAIQRNEELQEIHIEFAEAQWEKLRRTF